MAALRRCQRLEGEDVALSKHLGEGGESKKGGGRKTVGLRTEALMIEFRRKNRVRLSFRLRCVVFLLFVLFFLARVWMGSKAVVVFFFYFCFCFLALGGGSKAKAAVLFLFCFGA